MANEQAVIRDLLAQRQELRERVAFARQLLSDEPPHTERALGVLVDGADDRLDSLVAFVQMVASQRNAICKADHHAGSCRGAVNLSDAAAHRLAELGVDPKFPTPEYVRGCWICGNADFVIGQQFLDGAHLECREKVRGTTPPPHLEATGG